MNSTSAFLSLDGIDGTGKSTQIQRLAGRLRAAGIRVTTCVDPGGTPLGAKLREILLEGRATTISMRTEALLFMASRADLVEQVIRPALDRGEVVLSDRYLLANLVYQGHAGGMSVEELRAIGNFATGGLMPDRTIVLDMPVQQARQRRNRLADRLESRGNEYDERVRAGFRTEAEQNPNQIFLVDAAQCVESVHEAIWTISCECLVSRGFSLPQGL